MLLLFYITLIIAFTSEEKIDKPYIVLPVPVEFPNRNDRADQCWLRIEDIEIIETITIDCYTAQDYVRDFIQEYNARKIIEDKADIIPWSDETRAIESNPSSIGNRKPNAMTDWKTVTVMDPTTHHRLYVTKNADCKLIMYSRDGMTNYKVECSNILYFINERMNSLATTLCVAKVLMIVLLSHLFLL
ncbi:unnamed protein product [Danaus chrysippus]|uniref:(African queen) hypothetical protein n=1 Tax=Danaus chrysippus TaxID=151541 RepID=A0A8J2RAD5_9NEOP|nr:unnamed protein product [Danaus chrysippus]